MDRFWNVNALSVSLCIGGALAQPAAVEAPAIDAGALQALSEAAAGFVEIGSAVGSELLVIQGGEVLLHEAYGLADRESKRPWDTQTISNIRSMTKPITGAALQILIDRGKIALNDRVSEYLPGFDNDASRLITVRQVLTHRSGLPLTILETSVDEYPDLQTQANTAGEKGPEHEPDSKFWYSDIGTDVVGALVEVVSGERLDEFVQRELLTPLGMNDSFYGVDADDERLLRVGSLYIGGAKSWTRFWSNEEDPFYPFPWGSQTIYSTPLDYAKFLQMFTDGGFAGETRILSDAAIERILTPVSEMGMLGSDERFPTELTGLGSYYGQMMVLYCPDGEPEKGMRVFGHSGSDGTIAWAWPDRDLIIQYYTQSRGGLSTLRLEADVNRLIINPGETESEEIPERYREFLGTYMANFAAFENEAFEVLVKNGKLHLDIPSQLVFELVDAGDDGLWAFKIAPEQIQIEFERDESGTVVQFRLNQGPASFVIPRKGTKLAEEQGRVIVVSPEEMAALVGNYYDNESDRVIEVFVGDDGVLNVRAEANMVLQLRPTPERVLWQIRQAPGVQLSFQRDESGKVISMTRHVGEQTLVMERQE